MAALVGNLAKKLILLQSLEDPKIVDLLLTDLLNSNKRIRDFVQRKDDDVEYYHLDFGIRILQYHLCDDAGKEIRSQIPLQELVDAWMLGERLANDQVFLNLKFLCMVLRQHNINESESVEDNGNPLPKLFLGITRVVVQYINDEKIDVVIGKHVNQMKQMFKFAAKWI